MSATELAHLLQIWIVSEQEGLPPFYEQKTFPEEERCNTLRLVASYDGRGGSLTIHQDVADENRDRAEISHKLERWRNLFSPGEQQFSFTGYEDLYVNTDELIVYDS